MTGGDFHNRARGSAESARIRFEIAYGPPSMLFTQQHYEEVDQAGQPIPQPRPTEGPRSASIVFRPHFDCNTRIPDVSLILRERRN